MPDVKDLDQARIIVDLVVNQGRTMNQLPNVRPLSNRATNPRIAGEQLNMVQQGVAEPGGAFSVVLRNVADDFGEIV
jgi:hypothetical protein